MRLDTAILEEIMERARLSTREREAMRLDCSGSWEDRELAELMECSVSTVRTFRSRARKKVAAAQAAFAAEQLGRDREEQDAEELSSRPGFYGFLLRSIQPAHYSDHGPNIGLVWKEYHPDLGIERALALEGAAYAGAMITVGDLMGKRYPSRTAAENRERLEKRSVA